MIVNRGEWDGLPQQCKDCANLHVLSLVVDRPIYYSCGKYPLPDADEKCPRFIQNEETEVTE